MVKYDDCRSTLKIVWKFVEVKKLEPIKLSTLYYRTTIKLKISKIMFTPPLIKYLTDW